MLATFDDRGAAEVGDYYALAHGRPTRDEQQDWQLVEASRDGSHTTIRFSRALDTSDRQDNPLFSVPGEPVRVIAAMGDSAAVEYHGTTGRSPARVDLFGDSRTSPTPPFPPARSEGARRASRAICLAVLLAPRSWSDATADVQWQCMMHALT